MIGIGTGPVFEAPEKEAVDTLTYACEQGVNFVDFATAGSKNLSLRRTGFCIREEQNVLPDSLWGQL